MGLVSGDISCVSFLIISFYDLLGFLGFILLFSKPENCSMAAIEFNKLS